MSTRDHKWPGERLRAARLGPRETGGKKRLLMLQSLPGLRGRTRSEPAPANTCQGRAPRGASSTRKTETRRKPGGVLGERLKCQLLEFSFKHHGQFGAITSWHPCLGVTVLRTACLVKTFIGDWLPKNKAEKRVMMKNNPYGHLNHFFLMWALKEKKFYFLQNNKAFSRIKKWNWATEKPYSAK